MITPVTGNSTTTEATIGDEPIRSRCLTGAGGTCHDLFGLLPQDSS